MFCFDTMRHNQQVDQIVLNPKIKRTQNATNNDPEKVQKQQIVEQHTHPN